MSNSSIGLPSQRVSFIFPVLPITWMRQWRKVDVTRRSGSAFPCESSRARVTTDTRLHRLSSTVASGSPPKRPPTRYASKSFVRQRLGIRPLSWNGCAGIPPSSRTWCGSVPNSVYFGSLTAHLGIFSFWYRIFHHLDSHPQALLLLSRTERISNHHDLGYFLHRLFLYLR